MAMLDHITIGVKDVEISKKFYDAALFTLGFNCVAKEYDAPNQLGAAGYGVKKAFFWITRPTCKPPLPNNGMHIAFRANTKEQVRAFYDAAINNGGITETPPSACPEYHADYYAAYVYDPDGHKIEVVFGNTKGDDYNYDPS